MAQNISNFFRGSFTPNSYEKSLRKFTHEGSRSTIISNIARAVLYYLAILPAILLDLLMKPKSSSLSFFKNRIVHTLTGAFYKKGVYDPRKVIVAAYAIILTGTFFFFFHLPFPTLRVNRSSFPSEALVICNLIILAAGAALAAGASSSEINARNSEINAKRSAAATAVIFGLEQRATAYRNRAAASARQEDIARLASRLLAEIAPTAPGTTQLAPGTTQLAPVQRKKHQD